ncbi:PQ loop repeat protein [Pelomyxa schiedti]|nr:PQ loop repeat protein [Pelomyxa schiedti]
MCICDPAYKDGYAAVDWIMTAFHDCVYTPMDEAAFFFGLANIGFWLFAQIPQIIRTFMVSSAEAISFIFIFTWLTGDITNLLGCVLTQQLPTQTYTAVYFCIVDSIMMSQWTFYNIRDWRRKKKAAAAGNDGKGGDPPKPEPTQKTPLLLILLFGMVGLRIVSSIALSPHSLATATATTTSFISHTQPVVHQTRTILGLEFGAAASGVSSTLQSALSSIFSNSSSTAEDICNEDVTLGLTRRILGDICAWTSGCLYFFGRIPQIYHNWRRKSVEGLSPFMFATAASANMCYGLSIVLMKMDWTSAEFWENVFPYILGSWFTMIWQLVVLCQYIYYSVWLKRRKYKQLQVNPDC